MTKSVNGLHRPACSEAPEKTSAQMSTMRPINRRAKRTVGCEFWDGILSDAPFKNPNSGCDDVMLIDLGMMGQELGHCFHVTSAPCRSDVPPGPLMAIWWGRSINWLMWPSSSRVTWESTAFSTVRRTCQPTPPVPSQPHHQIPIKGEEIEEVEHPNNIITVANLIFSVLGSFRTFGFFGLLGFSLAFLMCGRSGLILLVRGARRLATEPWRIIAAGMLERACIFRVAGLRWVQIAAVLQTGNGL